MDPMWIVQLAVKVLRYVPFFTAGVLLAMCKFSLAPRSARASLLLGLGFGLAMVAWLARYALEQVAPRPVYDIAAIPGNILYVTAPSIVYDILTSAALVLAYASLARAVDGKEASAVSSPSP